MNQTFNNSLHPARLTLPRWPRPSYASLISQPIMGRGQDADLRLELDYPCPLRYWTSRVGLRDRPQTEDGYYEGGWSCVEVEACVDGRWVLIDGYQGHMV